MAAAPRRTRTTPQPVVRIVEAHGSARSGWEAAVNSAVKSVAAEAGHPVAVEVGRLWADLDGASIRMYRASVKVAYRQALAPPTAARRRTS